MFPARLQAPLQTIARRRMAVVVATAVMFLSYVHAFDIVVPLWVTDDLGFSASDWARLRSVRFVGVAVGTLLLGALADRIGQRRMAVATLLLAAGVTAALATGGDLAVWAGMFLLGGLISTAFVSLNTLTQEISERRRGMANAIYRSVGQAMKVVAPAGATALAVAWGGYPLVLDVAAVLLAISAVVLWFYPGEDRPAPFRGWRSELHGMFAVYATAWRNGPLMRMLVVTLLWATLLLGVVGFLAIRLTRELGMSDAAFGLAVSAGSVGGLLANLAGAALLDRVSIRIYTIAWSLLTGVSVIVVGLTDSVPMTVAMLVVFETGFAAWAAPSFVWVSREAEPGRIGGALSMHKLLTAVFGGLVMVGLGVLEPILGLKALLLMVGCAATAVALAHLVLREPPRLSGSGGAVTR